MSKTQQIQQQLRDTTLLPVGDIAPIGRPTVITEDVVLKLEAAFQQGNSDSTACVYAGISRTTYYEHLKNNPVFSNRILAAKATIKLLAGKRLKSILQDGADRDAAGLVKWALEKTEKELYGETENTVTVSTTVNLPPPPDWFNPDVVAEHQAQQRNKKGESHGENNNSV